MHALIDLDILVYKCGFAAEHKMYVVWRGNNIVNEFRYKKEAVQFVDGDTNLIIDSYVELEPLSHALHLVNQMIETCMTETGASDYTGFLTGKDNFRDKVATIRKYKDRDSRKPAHYDDIRKHMIKRHKAVVIDGMEADDALAMAQMEGEDTVICSIDKDLRMIPGYHFNLNSRVLDEVSEIEGYRNFFKQMIQGDDTDTIPGIYKLTGEKCKKQYLDRIAACEDTEELIHNVLNIYYQAVDEDIEYYNYLNDEALPEIAKLLWMSRYSPNDCPFFRGE